MSKDAWKTIWRAVILIIIFWWIAAGVKELLGIKTHRELMRQKALERMQREDPSFNPEEHVAERWWH